MAFDFHQDRGKYFQIQSKNSEEIILPLIQQHTKLNSQTKVLEIGCRDGGVLMPFYNKGCHITGLEISEGPLIRARENYKPDRSTFINMDIHDYVSDPKAEKFDVILLKDTIEHIPNQEKLIKNLHKILNINGVIYFGYPPWQNPYGGHQQVCTNKICAVVPYYHLLPNFIYYNIIKRFSPNNFPFIKATKETKITPEKFERFINAANFKILKRDFYLISPAYKYKFNLKPRKQFKLISSIPYFRNFFTTTCDYIIALK